MPFPTMRRWLGVELIEVSVTERVISGLGGLLSMLALMAFSSWVLPSTGAMAVVASMGASAVLLFAVPHGQLSQPWPVIAGHGVSGLIGVVCARSLPDVWMAAACAVGLAILCMHQLKCIHPPGGATAFTAVMGGPAIHDMGYQFVLFPVLANAVVMVLLAMIINYAFAWRRYPAVFSRHLGTPSRPAATSVPTHEEVLAAVKSLDSFVDVSEEDLIRLVELLSRQRDRR